jgi:hypothetical protein
MMTGNGMPSETLPIDSLECFHTTRVVQDFSQTAATMVGEGAKGINLKPMPGTPASIMCFYKDVTVSLPTFPSAIAYRPISRDSMIPTTIDQ